MTDEEIIAYFQTTQLPETPLQIDRATVQHNVHQAVADNLELMKVDKNNDRCRHRLIRIAHAIDNPYNGPGIPRF